MKPLSPLAALGIASLPLINASLPYLEVGRSKLVDILQTPADTPHQAQVSVSMIDAMSDEIIISHIEDGHWAKQLSPDAEYRVMERLVARTYMTEEQKNEILLIVRERLDRKQSN